MRRDSTNYVDMARGPVAVSGAVDVSKPVAGFYRHKLRSGGVAGGVRLFYGPPADPVTGETLDRSPRWQAEFDGEPVADFDDVWPKCAGDPITEQDYRAYVERREWALKNAPDSAYAKRTKRHDPLSTSTPLPL